MVTYPIPMVLLHSFIAAAWTLLSGTVTAEPVSVQVGKTVIVGDYNATNGVEAFLGVKYANHKRFEHAVLVDYQNEETLNATVHAPACSQINNATGWNDYGNTEDCLFLEIYRPHNEESSKNKKQKLPVLVWIHGGGGTYGSANGYLGYNFVQHSISIDKPVILVTINYRLAAWGLLGGKEALKHKAVNLGLYDQRTALEWVQDNIDEFGGDKNKVTLFGQSFGSMNVHYHFLDEHSKLFRAAIMESGTVCSNPAIDSSYFQSAYDEIVAETGCQSKADTLSCLKEVDLGVMQNAVNKINANITAFGNRPWGTIIDGDIIPDVPSKLIARGKFPKKPFISGDVMDEGTFSPKPTPMDTVDALLAFFKTDYLNKGTTWLTNNDTVAKILELYSEDPALGSPFNTGNNTFGLGANFKRAAALSGDARYQAPRRSWFADTVKNRVDGWSYQLSQLTPSNYSVAYGVYHTTDLAYVFLQIPESQTGYYELAKKIVNYWINFAYTMNPNGKGSTEWPQYGTRANLMNFVVGNSSIIQDTFRKEAISYLVSVQSQFGNPR